MNDQQPKRDPRLEGKRDGSTMNQAPFQMPATEHKGHKADDHSIVRSKNPKLKRKYAQQMINAGKGTPELQRMAARPSKKKG